MEHGEIKTTSAGEGQPGGMRCRHRPQEGTIYTTGGRQASLRRSGDFPVEAMCADCGRPVRREQYEVTSPAGDWRLKYPTRLERALERLDDFKARHPEITVHENGQSASWFDDDGPQRIRNDSPEHLAGYLEAKFDRS